MKLAKMLILKFGGEQANEQYTPRQVYRYYMAGKFGGLGEISKIFKFGGEWPAVHDARMVFRLVA